MEKVACVKLRLRIHNFPQPFVAQHFVFFFEKFQAPQCFHPSPLPPNLSVSPLLLFRCCFPPTCCSVEKKLQQFFSIFTKYCTNTKTTTTLSSLHFFSPCALLPLCPVHLLLLLFPFSSSFSSLLVYFHSREQVIQQPSHKPPNNSSEGSKHHCNDPGFPNGTPCQLALHKRYEIYPWSLPFVLFFFPVLIHPPPFSFSLLLSPPLLLPLPPLFLCLTFNTPNPKAVAAVTTILT